MAELIKECCGKPESECKCDKPGYKDIYILANFSISEVYSLLAATIKGKAKQEGKEIPCGEISCLVLNKVGGDIAGTIYTGKDGITGTFFK
jgi:hypothetical protein